MADGKIGTLGGTAVPAPGPRPFLHFSFVPRVRSASAAVSPWAARRQQRRSPPPPPPRRPIRSGRGAGSGRGPPCVSARTCVDCALRGLCPAWTVSCVDCALRGLWEKRQRSRTGGPHGRIHRNGRGPGAGRTRTSV
eukprot:gene16423-biopygen5256